MELLSSCLIKMLSPCWLAGSHEAKDTGRTNNALFGCISFLFFLLCCIPLRNLLKSRDKKRRLLAQKQMENAELERMLDNYLTSDVSALGPCQMKWHLRSQMVMVMATIMILDQCWKSQRHKLMNALSCQSSPMKSTDEKWRGKSFSQGSHRFWKFWKKFWNFENLIPGPGKVWNLEFGFGKVLDILKSTVKRHALYSTCTTL